MSSELTGAGHHVAQLDAVADLVGGVDDRREELAVAGERELGDVADVQLGAVGQLAQDQVGAARTVVGAAGRAAGAAPARPPPAPAAGAGAAPPAGRRRRAMQRDVRRGFTREREAADVRVFLLLATRQVDHGHAALHRPPLAAQPLRLGPRAGWS